MNRNTTSWEGFAICGDASELDLICQTEAYISLDRYDITRVLSSEGDNYVTTATSPSIAEALKTAADALPQSTDKASDMLIHVRYGARQPIMSDLRPIAEFGSKADIVWGIGTEPSLGENFKVVIVASIP